MSGNLPSGLIRVKAKAAADGVLFAFDWGSTAEGHFYWQTIYQRLLQMARMPPVPYAFAGIPSSQFDSNGGNNG